MIDIDPKTLTYDDNGLIPAIVQDAFSKEVLMLAYMNEESLRRTIAEKETWFYSRSRNELWHKGATSGNRQKVLSIRYDCDRDALLIQVKPQGPACHRGTYTCFSETGWDEQTGDRFAILTRLEELIAKRDQERPEKSYTTYLFEQGLDKILKKVGEETTEVVIAAKNQSADELRYETADLLYHLLVLLRQAKLPLDEVLAELQSRFDSSD